MAFALRYRLGSSSLSTRRRTASHDAAGFTSCCGLVSCSTPLRTPPLDDARGLHYRGPWRLPGPDSHRPAALSLSLSYVTTTSLSSWRPSCWTHPDCRARIPGGRCPQPPARGRFQGSGSTQRLQRAALDTPGLGARHSPSGGEGDGLGGVPRVCGQTSRRTPSRNRTSRRRFGRTRARVQRDSCQCARLR